MTPEFADSCGDETLGWRHHGAGTAGINAAVRQSSIRHDQPGSFQESALKNMRRNQLSIRLRRAMMAVVAGGMVAAPAAHANPDNGIVVVPPTDLPELARQSGEVMLLRDTVDGRAILYVEQEQGARLAIFDVTDTVHIKSEGSVQLNTDGPFDFVAPVGGKQELIRYRQSHQEAVLDFHQAKLPSLKQVQGLTLQGPITALGNDGFIVSGQDSNEPAVRDYQVVDTASANILRTVFDVKQVREEISKADTGTTFLLAEDGLYVVRRPAAESEKRRRDEEWVSEHAGN